MAQATDKELEVRRFATEAFGRAGDADNFYNDDRSSVVSVLIVEGAPVPGYQTCSTITLHEASNKVGSRNVAVELVGVAAEEIEWLPNLLSTAAFYIIRDGWTAAPGVLFELLVEEYDPGTSLPHLLWVPPSPWAGLHGVETSDGGSVHWLLGVAVSDAEAEFIKSNGFDAFEELMDKAHLDYFDFSRRSLL